MTQALNNPASKEFMPEESARQLQRIIRFFSIGFAAGILMNGETLRWYEESKASLSGENDSRPPKLQSGRKAKIGGVALGNA